ncbi:putative FmdB family regulatory protein [Rhodovulum bhavnagarense]|uniref:Putative FmdB family regulatory protein n=1 Tax=Rhodovulum bhavnagarense TaxID=992286 RepID=A0A4R2RR85_9RHOB|nr:zinc ribbon domain-containing protein [Rhodovulum bhavnagarense]TCP62371.1 putative FmdB family regulatory protein [Rhodovulum bhavnagarense]
MPIYAYKCLSCEAGFEVLAGMNEAAPLCPECGATDPLRQLSRVAATGKIETLFASARKQAAAEGHFSNYSKAEKDRIKRT